MSQCRTCHNSFQPTAYQIRKNDYRCLPCRRMADKAWRAARKAEGRPVIPSKVDPAWMKAYDEQRKADPAYKRLKAELMRKYRNDPRLRMKHEARWITQKAIKAGRLIKQPCEKCGEHNVQAHHHDYTKPLDVTWLCLACHRAEHAQAEGQ